VERSVGAAAYRDCVPHDDVDPSQRKPSPDLAGQAGPRKRVLDDHMYEVPTAFGSSATFRLQLFTAPGMRPLAHAIQATGDAGSIVNSAEPHVWQRELPDQSGPPLWVEQMPSFFDDDEPSLSLVSFERDPDDPHLISVGEAARILHCPTDDVRDPGRPAQTAARESLPGLPATSRRARPAQRRRLARQPNPLRAYRPRANLRCGADPRHQQARDPRARCGRG
jgi:hypothetical protein